jgi:hypothetical protein
MTKPRTSDAAAAAAAAATRSTTTTTTTTTQQSRRPNGCLYHDWYRLHPHSSSGGHDDDGTDDKPLVSAAEGTEMGIVVQRDFMTEEERRRSGVGVKDSDTDVSCGGVK